MEVSVMRAGVVTCLLLVLLVSCTADDFKRFSDNPENRELYEKDLQIYEDIEARHGRYARVNGIELHYLEFGARDGTPMVLIPGSSSTAHFLNGHSHKLADAGYQVLIIDPRGRGKTQVEDPRFSIYDVADDIKVLMDQKDIECAIVGGHSKGGFSAAAFYDEYPDRVMGLILMDGGSWSDQRMRELHYFGSQDRGFFESLFDLEPSKNPASRLSDDKFATRFEAFQAYMESVMYFDPDGRLPLAARINGEVSANFRQNEDGSWQWHVDGKRIMGTLQPGIFSHPATKQRLLQWSQQSMIPEVVFRNLDVAMLIMDPQSEPDEYSVSDYNEHLTALHPALIQHEIYENTPHAMYLHRPRKFLDDILVFGNRVRETPPERCR